MLSVASIYVADQDRIPELWQAFAKLGNPGLDRVAVFTVQPTTLSEVNPHYVFDLYWDEVSQGWQDEIVNPLERLNPLVGPSRLRQAQQDLGSRSLAPLECNAPALK
jgi:hypothetical protein